MNRRERLRTKIMHRVNVLDNGCHIWTGPTSGDKGRGLGYARMNVDGATMAVHIVAWVIENGPVPPRKQLDHICNVRLCVNHEHLQLVTHKKNQKLRSMRRKEKGNDFVCDDQSGQQVCVQEPLQT